MKKVLTLLILLFATSLGYGQVEFGAYYTKLNTGQPWEEYSRTMDRTDIVVNLNKAGGQLIFWRGNSFLPVWKTKNGEWKLTELIPRSGDGNATMPDLTNTYSHVQLVKNDPHEIIIDWRYLPTFTSGNPHGEVNSLAFVNEVFTITDKGKITRIFKEGTENTDDWNDPLNQTTQKLQLSISGIKELSKTAPQHSPPSQSIKGNPIIGSLKQTPLVWFNFNDPTQGRKTKETISKLECSIPGPKALWKKGVSGTAIEFDGYHTEVTLPASQVTSINGQSVTVEGWFCLGAYPWNWAPIIQQGDDTGFFFGIDSHGYPGFNVKVDNQWQELTVPNTPPYTDKNHLPLFRWTHFAGTYSKSTGMMFLYINGQKIAEKLIGKGGIQSANAEVRIGKAGIDRRPAGGTHDTSPSNYGIDGLIDEVKIFNTPISEEDIATLYQSFNPGEEIVQAPDMQKRSLPLANTGGKFEAMRTRLNYFETWDNLWRFGKYADLVVGFDQVPTRFIFWHGVSYIPMMSNELNQNLTNEFNETMVRGDDEPMSDKGCFDSHVRVIEDTPARKVVSWRYRLCDVYQYWANYDPTSGWGDQSEWLWTIYPDGIATKRMRCYTTGRLNHEWDEQIIILGEGQHPESIINKAPVMTLVDYDGKTTDLDWNPKPPKIPFKGNVAQLLNFTGEYKPFSIQNFSSGTPYAGEITWYSVFPSWNHWPTAQIYSSGRNASFPDRAGHSSISNRKWPFYTQYTGGKAPYYEETLMEGMTNQAASTLGALARSWLKPPVVSALKGGQTTGYEEPQRAYLFTLSDSKLSFKIEASQENPIRNLCFVIKNWNSKNSRAQLKINQVAQTSGPNFRQGTTIDPDGTYTLIVWVGLSAETPQEFSISKN